MSKKLITLSLLFLFLVIPGLFSCGSSKKNGVLPKTNSLVTPVDRVARDRYILGVGDLVNVLYYEDYSKLETNYSLNVRDEIEVISSSHPDINSKLVIRPDGKVSLQRIGEIMIVGSTPTEVSNLLNKKFSQTLRDPEIAVNVTKFHTPLDEIFKSLESLDSKQRITATVRADGYITLPMIGDIKAEGLTVEGFNDEITEKYSSKFSRLSTDVILADAGSRQVLVLGEVRNPGIYPMPRDLGALQAVSLAGGYKDSAELKSVLLIRKGNDDKPFPIKTDLSEVLSSGDITKDVILEPFDVVYVPKTSLDQVTTFLQKIYRLIPSNLSFGFSYILNRGAIILE